MADDTEVEEAGSIGARLDLVVRAGDTLGPFSATLTDVNGVALDITGYTFEGGVSRIDDPEDGVLPLDVTVTNAEGGVISFKMADSGELAGASDDFFVAEATYAWFLRYVDTNNNRQTFLYGYVKVAKEEPV